MALGNFGGRPKKSVEDRRLEGDTRQRGAKRHEQALRESGDLPFGLPDMPKGLAKLAKQHWKDLMNVPGIDRLLREADFGTVTGLCQSYEGAMLQSSIAVEMSTIALDRKLDANQRRFAAEASEAAHKLSEKFWGRYVSIADRIGLHAAARARLNLRTGDEGKKKPLAVMPPPDEWKRQKTGVSA